MLALVCQNKLIAPSLLLLLWIFIVVAYDSFSSYLDLRRPLWSLPGELPYGAPYSMRERCVESPNLVGVAWKLLFWKDWSGAENTVAALMLIDLEPQVCFWPPRSIHCGGTL